MHLGVGRSLSRRLLLPVTVAAATLLATGLAPAVQAAASSGAAPAAATTSATATATKPRVMWGTYVNEGGGHSIATQEARIGRTFAIDHRFFVFGDTRAFATMRAVAADDLAHNRVPLWNLSRREHQPSWAGYWAKMAAGEYDSYLVGLAATLRSIPGPVFLIWQHEPENNAKDPYSQGTSADFKAAWAHLRQVMAEQQVSNVKYLWTIMAITFRKGTQDEWYPGDALVDTIVADGYNWSCSVEFGDGAPGCGTAYEWRSFAAIFGAANAFAAAHGKPWWVGETATAEDPDVPDRKRQWLLDMAATAKSWPRLTGINYFQGGMNTGYFDIGSSPGALEAYRSIGLDRYFTRRSAFARS